MLVAGSTINVPDRVSSGGIMPIINFMPNLNISFRLTIREMSTRRFETFEFGRE
jgi:hypothetical protein